MLHAALRESQQEKDRTFFYLREHRVQRDQLPPPEEPQEEGEKKVRRELENYFVSKLLQYM